MAQAALQCKKCGKSFWLLASLKAHERTHSKAPEPRVTICDEVVGQVVSDERIHAKEERPFKCKHCGKCFRQKVLLSVHNRIHTGEKGYQCRQCGKCFSQVGNLNAHNRIHLGQMPYKCYECGRSFQFRGNLFRHGRKIHGFKVVDVLRGLRSVSKHKVRKQEKPFSCQECMKYFSNALGLKIHTRRVHSNKQTEHGGSLLLLGKTKPFKCKECGKHFIHKRGLELHICKAHEVSNIFVAESLNKSDEPTMQNWFHTKTRSCLFETCEKWFHPKGIEAHASKANSEKETESSNQLLGIPVAEIGKRQKRKRSCVCNKCGKHFRNKRGVRLHSWHAHKDHEDLSQAGSANAKNSYQQCIKQTCRCDDCDQCFRNERVCNICVGTEYKGQELEHDHSAGNLSVKNNIQHAEDGPEFDKFVRDVWHGEASNIHTDCMSNVHTGKEPGHFGLSENQSPEGIHCESRNTSEGKESSIELMHVDDERVQIHTKVKHTEEEPEKYVQNQEGNISVTNDINQTSDVSLFLYECDKCSKRFDCKRGLNTHMRWKHKVEKIKSLEKPAKLARQKFNVLFDFRRDSCFHNCEECDKSFQSEKGLQIHSLKMHREKNPTSLAKSSSQESSPREGKNSHECESGDDQSFINEIARDIHEDEMHTVKEIDVVNLPAPDPPTKEATIAECKGHSFCNEGNAYKCDECDKVFSAERRLKIHIGKTHALQDIKNSDQAENLSANIGFPEDKNSFRCNKCSRVFSAEKGLKIHLGKVHSQNDSTSSGNLSAHVACSFCNHGIAFECSKCSKVFGAEQGLKIHMAKKHPEYNKESSRNVGNLAQFNSSFKLGKLFKCKKCGKDFSREQGMKVHISKAHTNQDKKNSHQLDRISALVGSSSEGDACKCNDCEKGFSGEQGLKIHMGKIHADQNNENADQSGNLSSPNDCSNEENSHKCDKCSRVFSGEQGLKIHIGKIHADQGMGISHQLLKYPSPPTGCSKEENYHECDKCSRVFSAGQGLKIHMAKKHSEYNQESSCNVGNLAQINGISELGKPFKCWKCGKDFSGEQGLKIHFGKAHTNQDSENSHQLDHIAAPVSSSCYEGNACKCDNCGKIFRGEQGLKIHIGKIHVDQDKKISDQSGNLSPPNSCSDEENSHKCDKCSRVFSGEQGLKIHIGKIHADQDMGISHQLKYPSPPIGCSEKENTHECVKCSRVFSTEQGLKIHMAKKHSEYNQESSCNVGNLAQVSGISELGKPFKCWKCGKDFSGEQGLKIHFGKAHTNQDSENSHQVDHIAAPVSSSCNEGNVCKCDNCGKIFRGEQGLKIHVGKIHVDQDKKISDQSGNLSPPNSCSDEENSHKCDKCSRVFSGEQGLKIHMGKIHADQNNENADQSGNLSSPNDCSNEENSHKCDKCSRVFSGEQGLKIHIGKIHADQGMGISHQLLKYPSPSIGCSKEENSHECVKCSRIFSGEQGLKIHMAKKHSESNQESFCNVGNLAQTNGISELGKPFKCWKCGKDFSGEQGLKIHFGKAHTNQNSENSHQLDHIAAPVSSSCNGGNVCKCDNCGNIFSAEQGSKIHIGMIHAHQDKKNSHQSGNLSRPNGCSDEENSHKCDKCSRVFSGEQGLKIHIGKIHADQDLGISHQLLVYPSPPIGCSEEENSYECDICNRVFSAEQGLKTHMAKKHSESNQKSSCNVGNLAQANGISELGKPFKCWKCGKDFSGEQGLKIHFGKAHTHHDTDNSDQIEHLSAPVRSSCNEGNVCKCETCGKVFSGVQGLKIHIGKIHADQDNTNSDQSGNLSGPPMGCSEKESSHRCNKCSRVFSAERGLNMHRAKMHSENSKSDSCTEHLGASNIIEEGVEHKCQECGRVFGDERGLRIHIGRKHTRESTEDGNLLELLSPSNGIEEGVEPKCEECGRVFDDERGLKIHIGRMHTRKDTEDCDLSELLSTSDRIEEGVEHKCEYCSKTFGHEKEFIAHRSIVHSHLYEKPHTSEKGYQCPHCGRCFIYGSSFQKHLLAHSKNPLKRKVSNCSKGKADIGSTQGIYASPTKKEKTDKYKKFCCWICGDEFNNSSLLHKHYDNHLLHVSDQVPCTN